MLKVNIFMIILIISSIMLNAENPSSDNYKLKQWGFSSGSDPADPPTSTNYKLTGSAIGIISDEDAASSNYGILPGYYLGPIIGEILPPENVTISINGGNVELSWDTVTGANSYKVYSSDNPYSAYQEDTSGTFNGESWGAQAPLTKKFYYVKASTEIGRMKDQGRK